jgi:SAM-dependent methyltransferase
VDPRGARRGATVTDRPVATGYLDDVYAERFPDAEVAKRDALWKENVRFLRRWIRRDSAVLDIACDRGHFIGNVEARERWATDLRDMRAQVGEGIRFVQADGLSLLEHLPRDHFGVIFMSNYLEHLPNSDAVMEQLRVARALLKPGGRLMILQPNIRLVGGAYWDFIDHKVPLTEKSLAEAVELAGLETEKVIVRFLPYTTKARLGRVGARPWMVRWYLRLPIAWRLFGKQTLYIARRAA